MNSNGHDPPVLETSEGGQSLTSRIAAVAFADVADYSRHMADDSVGTIRRWAALREDILLHELRKAGGRYVSSAGDAMLTEFTSATSAVNWAVAVQTRLRDRPASDRDLQLRIGINIDDVVDDGDTLQSDGVVIAARIHQIAAPGEIVVTQMVRDIVRGRMPVTFRDRGAPLLKNIKRTLRIYTVETRDGDEQLTRPHASWTSRPTIAVLPFHDPSGPDDDRYFGEGITEDIITGLSRSRAMFVVARNSTLHIAQNGKGYRAIASELGVRYLLTGSIRRAANRLRIHAELVEADHSRALWASNFDGADADLFDFQDRIVSGIVSEIEPQVIETEIANLGNRPTDSLDAYDCVLRAMSGIYTGERAGYASALNMLDRAITLDPAYAQAHANLAWTLNFWITDRHSTDPATDRDRAIRHARKAVNLDPDDAFSLAIRAHILSLHEGHPHEALDLLEDALRQNSNLPLAWALSAVSLCYIGDAEEARDRLLNVWRLSPFDPMNYFFWSAAGLAELVAGDYAEASRYLSKAHLAKPNFVAALRLLSVAQALDGEIERARATARDYLHLDPDFSISQFMSLYPVEQTEHRERLILGLSQSGLPK
ncbi:adenylate/guanylate cyclase domain-containing protein [Pukyongiella litopenaei]|uniref:Tetratricopeptide repeat protein n=1 Tax=Pukyongiella litopenaei TaxID=2605946 RepID=A0A2S0MSI3_9RHOB|nr:tetratricopeptide repeat protein [Pukyongiella litopenaei]AVO38643.1 tetratricopeptide repeat protein [Pukyongiella litopenaei]